jgi:hypothetical protein
MFLYLREMKNRLFKGILAHKMEEVTGGVEKIAH